MVSLSAMLETGVTGGLDVLKQVYKEFPSYLWPIGSGERSASGPCMSRLSVRRTWRSANLMFRSITSRTASYVKRVVGWIVGHSTVSARRLPLIDREPLSPTPSNRLHLVRPRLPKLSQKRPMVHMICLLHLRDPG